MYILCKWQFFFDGAGASRGGFLYFILCFLLLSGGLARHTPHCRLPVILSLLHATFFFRYVLGCCCCCSCCCDLFVPFCRPNFSLRPDPPPMASSSSVHAAQRLSHSSPQSFSLPSVHSPNYAATSSPRSSSTSTTASYFSTTTSFHRSPTLPAIIPVLHEEHVVHQQQQRSIDAVEAYSNSASSQQQQPSGSSQTVALGAVQKQQKKVRLIQVPASELPSGGINGPLRPLRSTRLRPRPPRHPPFSPIYQLHKEVKHLSFLLLMVILAIVICVLLYFMLKQRRELTRRLIKDRYFTWTSDRRRSHIWDRTTLLKRWKISTFRWPTMSSCLVDRNMLIIYGPCNVYVCGK